jgi:hypothetical protein
MTGDECAQMFVGLDRSYPNIHELINRMQFGSGNDRYSIMMDQIERTGVHTLRAFHRPSSKTDSKDYVYDNGNVQRGMHR